MDEEVKRRTAKPKNARVVECVQVKATATKISRAHPA